MVTFLPVLDLSLLYSSRENGVSVVVRVDEYRLEVCKLDVDFENEIGLVDAAFMSLHVFSCCLLAFLASFDFDIFVHSLLQVHFELLVSFLLARLLRLPLVVLNEFKEVYHGLRFPVGHKTTEP